MRYKRKIEPCDLEEKKFMMKIIKNTR